MEKTIFEKILNKEIPSYKIYEDEYVYAFLDVFPVSKGHTLVIPKKHFRNILDCDSRTASKIGEILPKLANTIKNSFKADGINIFQNNEESAGQTVFHLHFHIVPRYKNNANGFDNLEVKWPAEKLSPEDFTKIQNIILKNL